jgi:hypothetical protein
VRSHIGCRSSLPGRLCTSLQSHRMYNTSTKGRLASFSTCSSSVSLPCLAAMEGPLSSQVYPISPVPKFLIWSSEGVVVFMVYHPSSCSMPKGPWSSLLLSISLSMPFTPFCKNVIFSTFILLS